MLERLIPLKAEAERQNREVLVQSVNTVMMMLEGGVNVGPTMQEKVERIESLLRHLPP